MYEEEEGGCPVLGVFTRPHSPLSQLSPRSLSVAGVILWILTSGPTEPNRVTVYKQPVHNPVVSL